MCRHQEAFAMVAYHGNIWQWFGNGLAMVLQWHVGHSVLHGTQAACQEKKRSSAIGSRGQDVPNSKLCKKMVAHKSDQSSIFPIRPSNQLTRSADQ